MELPIEGVEKLTRIFGSWPTFHDAEVHRIALERDSSEGPTLECVIHVFTMTSDVAPSGHYVLTNHTLVTLRLTEVSLLGMAWFNRQNVLEDLIITGIDPAKHDGRRFLVELITLYGVGATVECKRVIVADVQPHTVAA